jgi:hypothetical protein
MKKIPRMGLTKQRTLHLALPNLRPLWDPKQTLLQKRQADRNTFRVQRTIRSS